jgi:hypothetical protein
MVARRVRGKKLPGIFDIRSRAPRRAAAGTWRFTKPAASRAAPLFGGTWLASLRPNASFEDDGHERDELAQPPE